MDALTLEQKQQQFHEFFTIKHAIKANARPLAADEKQPALDQLEQAMPYAFRIASEMSGIDAQALRPLRSLGDHAHELATFLNHQARKIDLMMSLILQQQDDPQYRLLSHEFGGGGVVLVADSPMQQGQVAELKLFLEEEAAAVFCYGEVIACQPVAEQYHISFVFTRIREEDQELLVRASLHLQTQQLRHRKQ